MGVSWVRQVPDTGHHAAWRQVRKQLREGGVGGLAPALLKPSCRPEWLPVVSGPQGWGWQLEPSGEASQHLPR